MIGHSLTRLRAHHSAFTLLEVVLVLFVASLVAFAAMSMLLSTGIAAATQLDSQKSNGARTLALARIAPPIRESALVLARSDDQLVLWVGDRTGDGAANLSELRVIVHASESAEVMIYDTLAPGAADASLSLSDDLGLVASAAISAGSLTGAVVLPEVSVWSIAIDAASPQDARAVSVTLTMRLDHGEESLSFVAALRCEGIG